MCLISPTTLMCAGLILDACGGSDDGSSLSPQTGAAPNTMNIEPRTGAATTSTTTPVCGIGNFSPPTGVQTWMCQLWGMTTSAQTGALSTQPYDMLVIEANNTIKGLENFNTVDMVAQLRTEPDGSACKTLVYINIDEAENSRTYWASNWKAPTASGLGTPDFIIKADPDGWAGDYPVASWGPRWQALRSELSDTIIRLAREGFDGVCLDWVEAYAEPSVAVAVQAAGIGPAQVMVDFITKIRTAGHAISPRFAVIQQNTSSLIDDGDGSMLLATIDDISQEDTRSGGDSGTAWGSASRGDRVTSADET